MRISDWSSDVCSSDLLPQDDAVRPHPKRVADKIARRHLARAFQIGGPGFQPHDMALAELQLGRVLDGDEALAVVDEGRPHVEQGRLARAGDRKSGGEGKSVSVRVDLGGARIFKKKNDKDKPII